MEMRLEQMGGKEAGLVINLARYEHDNPGYVKQHWNKATLRPFLTPTSGMEMIEGQTEATLRHKDFTEFIRKADITEEVYYPTKGKGGTATTTYFAHVGIMKNPTETGGYILFANWNDFLGEYFLTGGKANGKLVYGTLHAARNGTADVEKEKLIESFRNFAPTLYKVLTDSGSAVKAIQNFGIGSETLNVFAVYDGRRSGPSQKRVGKHVHPHLQGNQRHHPPRYLAQILAHCVAACIAVIHLRSSCHRNM